MEQYVIHSHSTDLCNINQQNPHFLN